MEKYKNPKYSFEERCEDLLSRMTLEEKTAQMDMIRGVELATKVHEAHFCAVDSESEFEREKLDKSIGKKGMGFVHDVYSTPLVLNKLQKYFIEETRLGIPCLFTGEALHGLSYPGAAVFPMPINMGATFDPELVHEIGHCIAAETRSLGIHEILAPNLDLARDPRWGRCEETFGEDTYLSSQMAYAIITGEQGEDISAPDSVVAEPKHYCVHGIPEAGLNCAPARVGQREVETAYLPVFEAGVVKAGAYNIMASYNCIDSEIVIGSEHYLREVLKERYGLKGYVRADFGAVKRLKDAHHMTASNKDSIEMAVNAGLDIQGFDFPNQEWQQSLVELVEAGRIPGSVVNDAVRRVLTLKFRLGLFEHPYTDEAHYNDVIRCDKHQKLSYKAAQESIVLLQNKNDILPLNEEISSIAVIGPSSGRQRIGSYSSVPFEYEVRSVFQEIKERVGNECKVLQKDGCLITDHDVETIPSDWFMDEVHLEFYNNDSLDGEPVGTQKANCIHFNWILAKPHRDLSFTGYSVRMKMRIKVNTHTFTDAEEFMGDLVFTTQDSVRVYVDGKCMINSAGENKMEIPRCSFWFVNGAEHDVEIEFICDRNGSDLTFAVNFQREDIQAAVDAAKQCEVVIIVCGDNKVTSGEGRDRCDIRLYGKQRQLIREIGKLKKPTILVLENGKAVDLSMEIECVDGIIETWFGGEHGAKAIADVLFGDICPSGKLPMSFPKTTGHIPCYYSMLPGGSEWFMEGDRQARYPFGYGLSYTSFAYDQLIVRQIGRYDFDVTVTVTNTGNRESDEVVQLYVEDVHSSIVTPPLLLKGFKRISLRPGESKVAAMKLDFDSFKLLNKQMKWVVEPGLFRIMIGKNSKEILLVEEIELN